MLDAGQSKLLEPKCFFKPFSQQKVDRRGCSRSKLVKLSHGNANLRRLLEVIPADRTLE